MPGDRFLEGRAALITGGLTGQGLAIAQRLACHGTNVAVGSLVKAGRGIPSACPTLPDENDVASVESSLRSHRVQVLAGHLDVRDESSISSFVGSAESTIGPIDILVNSAGIYEEHQVAGHPDELWERTLDVNLGGAFRMIRSLLPGMRSRRWGRIINIGSTAATVGHAGNAAYCASKAGLLGLTRCVALEGAADRVTCVMISPGWVETAMLKQGAERMAANEGTGRSAEDVIAEIAASNPQHRLVQAEEIAAMALHLCRDEALGITNEDIRITAGSAW